TLVLSVLISVFSVLFLLALLLGQAAETNLKGYRRLADVKLLADYIMAADELWPAYPEKISAMEAWLRKARELAHRLPVHQANLTKLRRRALSANDQAAANAKIPMAVADDQRRGGAPVTWTFASTEDQWQHDTLSGLVRRLGSFVDS